MKDAAKRVRGAVMTYRVQLQYNWTGLTGHRADAQAPRRHGFGTLALAGVVVGESIFQNISTVKSQR